MKPKRIILIRHGESEGNVDKTIYTVKPDYAINLTEKGKAQAVQAGQDIGTIIGNESVAFYVSPYYRTRQTAQGIEMGLARKPEFYREDPRIIEQEWTGALRPDGYDYYQEEERDAYGHFYYRFQGGESNADVYNRVTTFMDTLHRDFEKPNFPENVIIVTHGMTLRVFVMRWFHLTVEEFEFLRNPKNAQFYILEKQNNNKYKLTEDMALYEERRAKF